jgi:hypothetical protein
MTTDKKIYKNHVVGKPLISTISSGCKTPILEVKFSNLINAFYYPNSSIPRYSITCFFNPKEQKDFLKEIQTIEKNEGVETIIKHENEKTEDGPCWTGNVLLKFQNKDRIPIFIQKDDKEPTPLELQDELKKGTRIIVIYDILRYTKKNTMETEHGISFKPTSIYYLED